MPTASYKGRFTPQNKDKYLGNVKRIIYRSNWERKFMVYCDRNDSIKHWGSEEVVVRYRNPIDKKLHNYFPDFFVVRFCFYYFNLHIVFASNGFNYLFFL